MTGKNSGYQNQAAFSFLCYMNVEDIKTIAVCGAGTMGRGIAQTAAQAGYQTILFDVQEPMLEKAKIAIEKSVNFLVSKEKITKLQQAEILQNITFTANVADCRAEVIIEAIVENMAIKETLFANLHAVNSTHTIFASNTSSLSITALQQNISLPERFAGMHFFNPANIMKLVEIVKGEQTKEEVVDTLFALAKKMGKVPVHCKDAPGFIVNHVARTYYLEAMHLLETGVATHEDIDEILEATGFKMGPFKLMDLIGMDINFKVSELVWEALGKPDRLTPSNVQRKLVAAGELGKKTGKGFYDYSGK